MFASFSCLSARSLVYKSGNDNKVESRSENMGKKCTLNTSKTELNVNCPILYDCVKLRFSCRDFVDVSVVVTERVDDPRKVVKSNVKLRFFLLPLT